jgi:DNA-binding NtrC family response regulator
MATILLVDDDPLQALLRKSMLERRFLDVQRVVNAVDALCLVEQPQFAANLGLVISGHHMPGIGGPAFVAEIQARIPALKVLVIAGAGETRDDYASTEVCFRPRTVSSDELVALAGELLSGNCMAAAR